MDILLMLNQEIKKIRNNLSDKERVNQELLHRILRIERKAESLLTLSQRRMASHFKLQEA